MLSLFNKPNTPIKDLKAADDLVTVTVEKLRN